MNIDLVEVEDFIGKRDVLMRYGPTDNKHNYSDMICKSKYNRQHGDAW